MEMIMAPTLDASEYTVSNAVWEALTEEINLVAARIDAGEELVPEDVSRVRQLKNQVDSYVSAFNKAMRNAQANYKELIVTQLQELGYGKIDNYIQMQRKKQTDEQNKRLLDKQTTFNNLVSEALAKSVHVKDTALAGELLPALVHRFPKLNSASKNSSVTNWGPYQSVIETTMKMLDTFFADPIFEGATKLPIMSATYQQLLSYVRDGNLEHLTVMRDVFTKDAHYLEMIALKAEITTKEIGLTKVEEVIASDLSTDEKINNINKIMSIVNSLTN